jgi:hypothetical protein
VDYLMRTVLPCLIPLFLFFFCKKAPSITLEPDAVLNTPLKSGLPEKTKFLNAFLYARFVFDKQSGISGRNFVHCQASFNDPGKNLLTKFDHLGPDFTNSFMSGNVSVGALSFCGMNLQQFKSTNGFATYNNNDNIFPSEGAESWKPRWVIEGNGAMTEGTIVPCEGIPLPVSNPATYTVLAGKNYVLKVEDQNFDTLMVSIGSLWQRKITGSEKLVVIPDTLFIGMPSGGYSIKYTACVYSHCIRENRTYLFETVSELATTIQVKQQ